MNGREKEVIFALCTTCSEVGEKVFKHQEAHDCFCSPQLQYGSFQFSSRVLDYIRTAVREKMEREGPYGSTIDA